MKTYNVSRLPSMLCIGFDGENNWRPQAFDCTTLLQNHPNGTITLWILPHGETQAFPVALERDGNTVVWTPLSEEMTAATGALQLVCTDGTDVGKSAVVLFRVEESIIPGAEHPAAVPSWATQTVARAEAAADRAEEAAESIDIEQIEQAIQTAVESYLDEHPITVTETDPTVPAWAKQPAKPTYTASEVGALPSDTVIPPAVTEQDVAEWGFTKNTGTYSKPSGGIPKTDLASGVRTSLGKADTAYQKPSGGIPASDLASDVIPTVPQMATQPDMSDWTRGKTVDALTLKADFEAALQSLDAISGDVGQIQIDLLEKADKTEIPTKTSGLTNDSGFQTAAQVQTAIGNSTGTLQPKAITDTGNYFSTDTVEGALQEIGAELSGINTLLGTGVIS